MYDILYLILRAIRRSLLLLLLALGDKSAHWSRRLSHSSMHDVRAAAVLSLCFAMAHIFFQRKRQSELPRPRTRTQTAKARCEPEPAVPVEVLDSWTCSHCSFENRCLRSTLAGALECSNCRNDLIYFISPRKIAHKALLDKKPVQVRTHVHVGATRRGRAGLTIFADSHSVSRWK